MSQSFYYIGFVVARWHYANHPRAKYLFPFPLNTVFSIKCNNILILKKLKLDCRRRLHANALKCAELDTAGNTIMTFKSLKWWLAALQ